MVCNSVKGIYFCTPFFEKAVYAVLGDKKEYKLKGQ